MRFKNYLHCLLFLILFTQCKNNKSENLLKAKIFVKDNGNINFDVFKKCQILQREDSLYIFDVYINNKYKKGFIIKKNIDFFIREKDNSAFIKLDKYNDSNFTNVKITKNDIREMLRLIYKLKVNEVTYNYFYNSLKIKTLNFTVLYYYDVIKGKNNKLNDLIKINNNWYFQNIQ